MKNKIIKAFVPLAPGIWEALKSGDEEQIQSFLTQSGNRKGLIYLFPASVNSGDIHCTAGSTLCNYK